MMLEDAIKQQLISYVTMLEDDVVIDLSVADDKHSLEMTAFINEVVELSPKLSINKTQLERTPSFRLRNPNKEISIDFALIPLGHELSTFVLALLQTSGRAPKIDEAQIKRIGAINKELSFESYVSLSCHICPDVVQALNIIAILNPKVSHSIIDGGIYRDEIEKHSIMAVPSVLLNGESFADGRITLDEILDLIIGVDELTLDTDKVYDVVVVGGGPAGASAAIYAVRKGLSVVLISDRIGGQVLETLSIENLIGTPYTEGPRLALSLETHLKEYPVEIIKSRKVLSLTKDENITLKLEGDVDLKAQSVIVATGARWRNVNVPGEAELKNKGVAYCPHCDGPLFEGKDLAVIGGGNSGIEAAIDLAGIAKHVTVLEFLPELKADVVLQNKLKTLKNVDVITNAQTQKIHGESEVNGISYMNRVDESVHHLDLNGVFVQIGLVPNTEWLDDSFDKTRMGELIVGPKGETSVEGVFAAGDCTDSSYKQIIISMGSGATAGLGAFDYLIRK